MDTNPIHPAVKRLYEANMARHLSDIKEKYAAPCPMCQAASPHGHASMLMPQRSCPIDGFHDERPPLTQVQWVIG